MKYTLSMDEFGNRYWLCEHDSGELEPLPADFSLSLYADVREVEGQRSGLPIGTTVTLDVPAPDRAMQLEKDTLIRVLVSTVQREAEKAGDVLTAEEAHARVMRFVDELKDGSTNPAIAKAHKTVEARSPLQLVEAIGRSAADRLLKAQLAVKGRI